MKSLLILLLIAAPLVAAEPEVARDLSYGKEANERQKLDVYSPADGEGHPVVIWIHGGGWRKGDKAGVQAKPRAFVAQGFVFVSVNYRFIPQVTLKEMAGDVAQAIGWVHEHAKEYRGDPNALFVMGHSAGAHLAALICTDEQYLGAQGLKLADIRGCVPLDTAVYDAALQIESVAPDQPRRAASYRETFGSTVESQRALSPATHVAQGKAIPPFLIVHIDREDARVQSVLLAKKLKSVGIRANVLFAEDKTHGSLATDLGLPGDEPTRAIFAFLQSPTEPPGDAGLRDSK